MTNVWRLRQEVKRYDGRLIRKKDQQLSSRGADAVEATTYTTWHLGTIQFIQAADNWHSRFGSADAAADWKVTEARQRHIGIRYLNPHRPSTNYTHKNGSFFTADSFTYETSEGRHGFYRSLDQFVARHEVSFDVHNKTVVIDGRELVFNTEEGTQSLHEGNLWDKYHLDRYFPAQYSFRREHEFFSDLVQYCRPWHRYEADHLRFFGFCTALEDAAEEGMDTLFDHIRREYPELGSQEKAD